MATPLCTAADAHGAQRRRVAGVEAARHVGARDDLEHRLVVAQLPHAERLAEVTVQVDRHHRGERRPRPEPPSPGAFWCLSPGLRRCTNRTFVVADRSGVARVRAWSLLGHPPAHERGRARCGANRSGPRPDRGPSTGRRVPGERRRTDRISRQRLRGSRRSCRWPPLLSMSSPASTNVPSCARLATSYDVHLTGLVEVGVVEARWSAARCRRRRAGSPRPCGGPPRRCCPGRDHPRRSPRP